MSARTVVFHSFTFLCQVDFIDVDTVCILIDKKKQARNLIVVLASDPSEQDNNVKVTVFNVDPENGHSREGRSTVVFGRK